MSVSTISVPQQFVHQSGPSRGATVAKHAAIGGVIGAALGAGLSLTGLPIIGGMFMPIAAAIGGAAGIVTGGIIGLLRTRGGVDAARVGGSLPPLPPTGNAGPPPPPPPLR